MLIAELQDLDEVKGLVTQGTDRGRCCLRRRRATALSEVDVDESDIEELYGYLESQGIELVDDVDPAQAGAPAPEPSEAASVASGARRRRSI